MGSKPAIPLLIKCPEQELPATCVVAQRHDETVRAICGASDVPIKVKHLPLAHVATLDSGAVAVVVVFNEEILANVGLGVTTEVSIANLNGLAICDGFGEALNVGSTILTLP